MTRTLPPKNHRNDNKNQNENDKNRDGDSDPRVVHILDRIMFVFAKTT